MKKLLISLLLITSAFAETPIIAQQKHAEKALYAQEQLFGLTKDWIDIKIVPYASMKLKNAWGDTTFDEGGSHIEICDLNEYPASMPSKVRKAFQDYILQHEVMHIYMSKKRVPEELQDSIIALLQPYLRAK